MNPLPESSGVVLDAKQYRTSTVDQHATQIDIATLADAQQLLFASGRVRSWHHANPSGKVTPPPKGCSVTDGGHGCGGDQGAETGNLLQSPAKRILFTDALDLVGDRLDVALHLLPLLPQVFEQPAQARAQVLLGIFYYCGQVLAEMDGFCREGDPTLQ